MRRRLFATVAVWVFAAASASAQTAGGERVDAEPAGATPGFSAPPIAGSAGFASAPRQAPDLAPPDLPAVVVTVEPPAAAEVAIAPPDLPGVAATSQAPFIERPLVATGPAPDLPPPDLPPVIVIVDAPPTRPETTVVIAPPDLPDVRLVVEGPKAAAPQAAPTSAAPIADIAAALKARLDKDGAPAHPRLTRALRDEIAAFYATRAHAPLWTGPNGVTAAGLSLIAQLKRADEDGLEPGGYPVGAGEDSTDPSALAALDLNLSVAALMYARDARGGRIDARRLSNLIDPTLDLPDAAGALQTLASAPDAGAALQAYHPPHAGYRALRAKLREAREGASERVAAVTIPHGPELRVGMSDARVALVRERLKVEPRADTTYDSAVAEAVTSFQRERGLAANGRLTNRTVAALSGAATPRLEADLIANMERWRWLPRDLGQRHIFVNIPEFQVRVMDGATIEHQARVIVGKPDTPTPIFSDVMQFLVVNPSWFVPPSILKKEFLPKLASDPTYAERRGYQVIRRGNNITIRQPPGERNALGNIKFMFPNRHAVYLHDTPTRHLFGAERRAFSHGCVRVDQPFRLAEIVLGKDRGWTESRVRGLVGRGEQSVKMEQKLPIHLAYFTMFVDDLGRLQQRDDLYGHQRRVRAALGLDG